MDKIPAEIPVLPIRNAVLFPSISMPLIVGRERSIRAVEASQKADNLVLIVAQTIITEEDPAPEQLYRIGTLCKIENLVAPEKGSRQIVVTGISRFRVLEYVRHPELYLAARGELVADVVSGEPVRPARNEALFESLKQISREILDLLPGATEPLVRLVDRIDDPGYLTNVCAAYLNLSLSQKQELLETVQVDRRMEVLLEYMNREREVLSLQREIREKMSERINKAQREALLREQLRTIKTELGEEAEEGKEAEDLDERLKKAGLPEEAKKQADEELKRLRALPPQSAEYHVIRTYLDWLLSLPWNVRTEARIDLRRAREILESEHYGLEPVKKRILQFLSVAKLKNDLHGPILCLVGPPGVGKTSLGQSIARALDRKFIRTSLGGVRDEAEIRGHRRTYVGAMPGRIIQSIKRAGTRNPLMMLDEIDKLRADFHGDPSAAMLEVLDPEQNKTFTDHYLDLPFDLSDVFFICTANMVDTIPPALRDRMEMIEVTGYTSEEKLEIARRHLVPKLLREHGLLHGAVELPQESLSRIIASYTREAGVRELNRKIAALFRATAEEIVKRQEQQGAGAGAISVVRLTPDRLKEMLGPPRFFPEQAERSMRPGVATGLAWTPHGGDLLFIEVTVIPGKGQLILTGQLGDVMKESAQIALSLARSTVATFLQRTFEFSQYDVHIHVPAGAIPKDGPSAGVTILTALASFLSSQSVEPSLGMTGEITLRGAVLPVGGIKEKVLAAHRAGLKTILLPRKNEQDLDEIPEDVRREIRFVPVETVEEVLRAALKPGPAAEQPQAPQTPVIHPPKAPPAA